MMNYSLETRAAGRMPRKSDESTGTTFSDKTTKSTVSEYLRRIIPTDKWPLFFSNSIDKTKEKTKSNSERDQDPKSETSDPFLRDIDDMLFDAVPYNGDTDNEKSLEEAFERIHGNGIDMQIDLEFEIPMDASVNSNVSPIGNVSNYPCDLDGYDEDLDNGSDDDLDRILGVVDEDKATPRVCDVLNRTMETEHSDSLLAHIEFLSDGSPHTSLEEGCSHEHEKKKSDRKQKVWHKSKSCWMIIACVILITILAVMLGTMRIFNSGSNAEGTFVSSNASGVNNHEEKTASPTLVGISNDEVPSFSPLESQDSNDKENDDYSSTDVGASPWNDTSATIRPIVTAQGETASPTRSPSSPPSNVTSDATVDDHAKETSKAATAAIVREFLEDDDDDHFLGDNSLPHVQLDMGPMVGHTTDKTTTLWAYYRKPAMHLFEDDFFVEIMLFDSDGWVRTIDNVYPDPDRSNAIFATLDGLQPLTHYRYEMRILGRRVGKGSFRTAPPSVFKTQANAYAEEDQSVSKASIGDRQSIGQSIGEGKLRERNESNKYKGAKFDYILASCIDRTEYPSQPVWEAIASTHKDKKYPDFAIFAGDTVYMQESIDVDPIYGVNFSRLWYRNHEQRNEPHFAKFAKHTPMYSTWNNHDYGSEWTGIPSEQPGKEVSLQAFRSLWANPGFGQSRNDGVYYSFYWGDVHFIVTDDQWNRDPRRENRFGQEQTEWIRNELIHSRGVFKIIVVGSDIMERGWASDLNNIGNVVRESSIEGVLFHAGDIHRNEYKRLETGGFPYPVTQITSSGIAKVWRRPFVRLSVDTTVDDPFLTASFYGASSLDEFDTTWWNDPDLTCSSIFGVDRDREHSCTETIRLSDLRYYEC